jgi:uncharacterized repeat protein (TIGR01451 family)
MRPRALAPSCKLALRLASIASSLALVVLLMVAGAGAGRPLAAQELPSVGELQVPAAAHAPQTPQTIQRQVLVELADPPAAVVWAAALADRGVTRERAKENAISATRSQGTQSADLALTKSMTPASPTLGQNATFTLTVSNAGPNTASGIVVSDPLLAGLTYVSDDGGGAYSSATGLWTLAGSLAMSASATLHIVATIASTDPIVNVAQIAASSLLDPNPANNQSQVDVSAPRSADVALSMSVSSPTVTAGAPVTYTLTLKNDGDDPSYTVNVHEAFPSFPALVPTSSTASAGVFDGATGMWQLGSMANGATETLSVTFTAPNIAGPLTNNGVAAANTSDPNNANNSASATTQVVSPSAVSGTKTVTGTFQEQGTVTYTIVVTNNGTSTQQDNPGDEFDDTLPTTLHLIDASATSGTAAANLGTNTVSWNGSIAPGASVTITIHAKIATGTAGSTISNQGTVHFDADGNGTNESTAQTTNGTGGGATTFQVDPLAEVPTLSPLGLVFLLLLLAVLVLRRLGRRADPAGRPTGAAE